ncbi:hypothetical protein RvY_18413-1 [Ramazzottius varieornatus]|uniref:MACPF domain-containing protein n=1 Tax=Ramazzottius varieornatus TaxID=947166 RepID=A0A1D1W5M6_RAMVA|nr:hypothetical protein RvY_18413-1 [Ramazzottius varieornatus]
MRQSSARTMCSPIACIFLSLFLFRSEARLLPVGAGYVGAGYNVLIGNNDGARFTSGGPDSGLLPTRIILQKTLPRTNGYCPTEAICTETADGVTDDQYSVIADLQQYQRLFSQGWDFDTEEPLLPIESVFAGAQSPPITEARDTLEAKQAIVVEKRNVIIEGELRYNYKENEKLTKEFVIGLCELPEEYITEVYRRFILKWGTHVIVAVKVGHFVVNRYEIPLAALNSLVSTISPLTRLAHINMSTTSAAYKSEDFQDSEIVQKLVDLALLEKAPFRKWHFVTGSDKAPTPVHLTLRRLDSFITREFIEPGMEVECLTLATDVNIAEIRENIKTALLEYPIDPPSPAFQPIVRQFRSDWPRGM